MNKLGQIIYILMLWMGIFVPNLTFGAPIVKAIRPHTSLPFDVHLMVTNPADYVEEYAKIGVEYFTFHQETVPHMHRFNPTY